MLVFLEIFNLGTGEMVLILLTLLFVAACVGLVFILFFLATRKRQNNHLQPQVESLSQSLSSDQEIQANHDKNSTNLTELQVRKIALPQHNETRYVTVNDILRCEADSNYTKILLKNGENVLVSKSLKEYADLLMPHGFIRTHQSHLVNSAYVDKWIKEDGGLLGMENGDKIPIAKSKRDLVKLSLSNLT